MLSLVIQVITGHNNLNYHLKKQGKLDSDLCRLCGEHREESWLLLTSCPALARTRQTLGFNLAEEGPPLSLEQILGLLNEDHISTLYRYREE